MIKENQKDEMESYNNTIREINRNAVKNDSDCQRYISELKGIEHFLDSFGFLSFGRDFILCRKWSFSLQGIITSLELTMGSIVSCCENACLADANSLLRKYRDDMFFYLYISVFDSISKIGMVSCAAKEMEDNISKWIENSLQDFRIGFVLKAIASDPQLKEAVKKYNFKSTFERIGDRLNNFVHSNGYVFYNRNINAYKENEFCVELKALTDDGKYITVTFLFLLILCSPLSIMSTDYVDYLDCNETPPEDSQYWVAPFITQFIEDNIGMIDDNCYRFLQERTMMQL